MLIPSNQRRLREKFNLSRFAIDHPRVTLGFWTAVILAGILAFGSLKYALFPDITFPVVLVNVSAPLASVEVTESRLTLPIEQQLKPIVGLDDIHSTTLPGNTTVRVAFQVDTDLEVAVRRVKQAIEKTKLPDGSVVETVPLNLNESSAVTYVVMSSTLELSDLEQLIRMELLPGLTQQPGVLRVEVLGLSDLPQGGEEGPPHANQVGARIEALHDRLASAIPPEARPSNDGYPSIIRFNGKEALALQVIKQAHANTLDVVDAVAKEIQAVKPRLPEVRLVLASTQAHYIREAASATIEAIALAVLLSVIVIFPFLWNWQATIISSLAIPTSLLGTFIVMHLCGFNLETITLLAIALVVGIIVDDAIVDVENISRHLEAGESPRQAAIAATDEIGLTVTAATLTIAAVFLPVGLMGGVVGQFFRPFGLTVSAAVLISLLVARTLSPLLAVHWLRPAHTRAHQGYWNHFVILYQKLLVTALKARYLVLALSVCSLIIGIGMVSVVNKGFIPRLDRGDFNITFALAPHPEDPSDAASGNRLDQKMQGGALLRSNRLAEQITTVLRQFPTIKDILSTVGTRWGEPNKGVLYVRLHSERNQRTGEIQSLVRERLAGLSNSRVTVEDIPFVDTGGESSIQIRLLSTDLTLLHTTAVRVQQRLQEIPGLVDITSSVASAAETGMLQIEHADGKRVAYVTANLSETGKLGAVTELISKRIQSLLPPGVKFDLGGDSGRIGEVMGSFAMALAFGAACIYAVLFVLFRNWSDPFVIACSLPFSLVGAMLALLLSRNEFGIIAAIGVIFLMGLTNKNAILLVDCINQLRRSSIPRTEAILRAGAVRLRPILMTTFATIIGMVPIALGLGAGAELRAPMAIAIIGGLIASTILSLIVIPVIYSLMDDLRSSLSPSYTQ